MHLSRFRYLVPCLLLLAVVCSCATPLPSSYQRTTDEVVLEGNILAIAGDGDLVAAATSGGLFLRKDDGPWIQQEVPGLSRPDKVTCLAVDDETIYVGSDGEGLHILSEGIWEVKTSRYGGLADDGVLSIAFDGENNGLPGKAVWVGTRQGIAAGREDSWAVYRPKGDWLVEITGKSASGAGKVYLGTGFKLGRKGQDSDLFSPPVTAIGVGETTLVLGSRNSLLAVIGHQALAILKIQNDLNIKSLKVAEPVIWAGTDKGLLWGGLRASAKGKPWPTHHGYLGWSGYLFGSRDSQPFQYRWKFVGYNSAPVSGLISRGENLWIAQASEGSVNPDYSRKDDRLDEIIREEQITTVRLYPNISEYISRKETPQFENYGVSAGIRGKPTGLYVAPEGNTVWIGTTKGLWELQR